MRFLKNFNIYMFSTLLSSAVPFLLLPVMTHYLSPEDYGLMALYNTVKTFAISLIGLQLVTNISRHYFKHPKEHTAKVIGNLGFVLVTSSLVSMVVFVALILWKGGLYGIPRIYWIGLPLAAGFAAVTSFLGIVLRNGSRAVQYGALLVSGSVLNIATALFLVIGLSFKYEGPIIAGILTPTVTGIFSLVYLIRSGYMRFDFDREVIRTSLKISLPMLPHALSNTVINLSDRFLIEHFIDKAAVGLYSAGYAFGMIENMLISAITLVMTPWMYRQMASSEDVKVINNRMVNVTYAYIGVLLLSVVAITIGSHALINMGFLPPRFAAAKQYVLWVAVGYAFRGAAIIVYPYMVQLGRTESVFMITILAAAANIAGNYLLIPMFGAIAAAYTTILSYVIMLFGMWIMSQRLYPMPWLSAHVDKEFWREHLGPLFGKGR